MDERIWLHARAARGRKPADLLSDAQRAAGRSYVVHRNDAAGELTLEPHDHPTSTLTIAVHADENGSQILMGSLRPPQVDAYGAESIAETFLALCAETGMDLGRSAPAEPGIGLVQPYEMQGQLEFVDWIQYWSPAIVARWGIDYIKKGPFHRVKEFEHGAAAIWLGERPFVQLPRMSAAQYLGITLPTTIDGVRIVNWN